MFQRIKGAIDRSIAEEQARQKAFAAQKDAVNSSSSSRRSGSISRSSSTRVVESTNRRQRPAKQGQAPETDVSADTDPAVFEAAFVIDDTDEGTPAASTPQTEEHGDPVDEQGQNGAPSDDPPGATSGPDKPRQNGENKEDGTSNSSEKPAQQPGTTAELPPDIRAKLKKLEKLEKTYPELLRSYRIAHGRATSIEPFERALRENTPLTSIKDPGALIEYLNQLNLKSDMVMDELKRVSTERDSYKKKAEETDKELTALKDEVATLKTVKQDGSTEQKEELKPDEAKDTASDDKSPAPAPAKNPVSQVLNIFSPKQKPHKSSPEEAANEDVPESSEDLFSYESELPELRAELALAQEHSAGLVESLENVSRELSEVRDSAAVNASAETQLRARIEEITVLEKRLDEAHQKLQQAEASLEEETKRSRDLAKEQEGKLAASESRNAKLDVELKKAAEMKATLDKRISNLTSEIESLKQSKLENEAKIDELTKSLQAKTAKDVSSAGPAATTTPAATTSGGGKKKNKKKKKAANLTAETPVVEELRAEIDRLKDEVFKKDEQIQRLESKRKTEDELREEIESLQENLVNIGQDHVEAKEQIKALESERKSLKERIAALEQDLAASTSSAKDTTRIQSDYESLKQEFDELKAKSTTLQSDLGAAQQLAQSRYKDLTELREVLQKVQPELKSLRQDSASLKAAKEELAAKSGELRNLERPSDREDEAKSLREKLAAETGARLRAEDEKRVAGRDLRRAEAEKIELSAKEEKTARELQRVQEELAKLRPRVQELEDETTRLRKEADVLREEAELKTTQYANAQKLLGSMRDQTAELSIQLKENQAQCESLDEELAETRKMLNERTREAETMRRLLADAAIEERDRLEDESATLARKKAREVEELRTKIRDLERELRTVADQKDELEGREREWRKRREELEAYEERASAEVHEMRSTVSNLRSALDASEQQVRETEKQKSDLRRMLDDYRVRYDKLSKDLKSVQARLSSTAASAGRSSVDSTRSSGVVNGSPGPQGPADVMYLKTILLQFLEQKDNKLRAQLVPVLGKLLKFDKTDEQKWLAAVQHFGGR
ncbi:hypothetical protein VTK73DRAFT_8230 [Phialemonium thermophilum]|uniref:GRIP domain-containing protein n=1 Tax=Phialemonium thermophilum TaxID=223376 RepID=A0ABR3W9H3_9PEZI